MNTNQNQKEEIGVREHVFCITFFFFLIRVNSRKFMAKDFANAATHAHDDVFL